MPLKKTLKIWSSFILFLFFFPVIVNYIPSEAASTSAAKLIIEPANIVHASNVAEEDIIETTGGKALLYFTHSHEAYEPVTKAVDGKVAVFHRTENIMNIGKKLQTQLAVNGIETDILDYDNVSEMEKKGIDYGLAYRSIRPQVIKKLGEVNYDIIIDLHRDSIGPDRTTTVYEGEKYANVTFVVGKEHANYKLNEAKAQQVKDEMEKLVPGITRGDIILKHGPGVDGKYNQDLSASVILIELGGIGNNEAELNRTIVVIAEAVSAVISNSTTTKY
jgi:stage II sporulation protein P